MSTESPPPVSEQTVHIKVSTLVAVIILLINVIVLGPGSWLITTWRDRYESQLDGMDREMKAMEKELIDIRTIIYSGYLSKDTYRAERTYTEQRLQSLQEQVNAISTGSKTPE